MTQLRKLSFPKPDAALKLSKSPGRRLDSLLFEPLEGRVLLTPVALPGTASTAQDAATQIQLQATDPESDPLTYAIVQQPLHGALTSEPGEANDALWTYTPDPGYAGQDSFTFTANDGTHTSSAAKMNIAVGGLQAFNANISGGEDQAIEVSLMAADPGAGTLSYTILTQPANGVLTTAPGDPDDALWTFTPNADWNGVTTLTFVANNGTADSNVATVSILVAPVQDAPVAQNQSVTLDEDTELVITLVATDADGQSVTYEITVPPENGSILPAPGNSTDAQWTFVPNPDWNGVTSFKFTASDGTADSNEATVTVTVNPVQEPPDAQNQGIRMEPGETVIVTLVATDAEGDPLTYSVTAQPLHGTLASDPGAPNDATWTYTPNPGYTGQDTFIFIANDGTVNSDSATVTIAVGGPVANDATASGTEDVPLVITLDADDFLGADLAYTIVTQPENGTLSSAPGDADDATWTFTPDADWNGTTTLVFRANNGIRDTNDATVTIVMAPAQEPPVANDQSVTGDEDKDIVVTVTGTDPEGDSLTYRIVSQPLHGSVATAPGTATDAQFTFTPDKDWNGTTSFTFVANDGTLDSAPATVNVTVNPLQEPPTANAQTVNLDEDGQIVITLTATDAEGDPMTYRIVQTPANAKLETTPGAADDAEWTFKPNANWNGTTTFTFVANDGTADSLPATVTVIVAPVQDSPTATNVTATSKGGATNVTLKGSDPDSDTLTYIIVTQPTHGRIEGAGEKIVYIPELGYSGTDTFTYKVNDGSTDSSAATGTITVTGFAYLGQVVTRDGRTVVSFYDTDAKTPGASDVNFVYTAFPGPVPNLGENASVAVTGGYNGLPTYVILRDNPTDATGIGIVIEGPVAGILDYRTDPSGTVKDVGFITASEYVPYIRLNSGIAGGSIGGQTLGDGTVIPTDPDQDGTYSDTIGLFTTGGIGRLYVANGYVRGDAIIGGNLDYLWAPGLQYGADVRVNGDVAFMYFNYIVGDSTIYAEGVISRLGAQYVTLASELNCSELYYFYVATGTVSFDVTVRNGHAGTIAAYGGGFTGSFDIARNLGNLYVMGGDLKIGDDDLVVGGSVGKIIVAGDITGDMDIGQKATAIWNTGDIAGNIKVGGDLTHLSCPGEMDGDLTVGGSVTLFNLRGDMLDTTIDITKSVEKFLVGGSLTGSMKVGTNLQSIRILGSAATLNLDVGGYMQQFICHGNIAGKWTVKSYAGRIMAFGDATGMDVEISDKLSELLILGDFSGYFYVKKDIFSVSVHGAMEDLVFRCTGEVYSLNAMTLVDSTINGTNMVFVVIQKDATDSMVATGVDLGKAGVFGTTEAKKGSGELTYLYVGGDLTRSDVSAGVFSSDATLGNSDDTKSSGAGTIGRVWIGGVVSGGGETHGIMAETGSFLLRSSQLVAQQLVTSSSGKMLNTVKVAVLG
ncbi:MAG TPA: Ig-like domain-containing protein [Candidatus Brocadiia bacterium]|nr:Ig-like domain-containing protein [Candidatus Brocadiia bacterium]